MSTMIGFEKDDYNLSDWKSFMYFFPSCSENEEIIGFYYSKTHSHSYYSAYGSYYQDSLTIKNLFDYKYLKILSAFDNKKTRYAVTFTPLKEKKGESAKAYLGEELTFIFVKRYKAKDFLKKVIYLNYFLIMNEEPFYKNGNNGGAIKAGWNF